MSTTGTSTPRRHAYSDAAAQQLPEPSYAERVRTLVAGASLATLSTVSRKRSGYPFGSLMPYAIDLIGRPIFLISSMAMHTQNLEADSRASLFVGQIGGWRPTGVVSCNTDRRCPAGTQRQNSGRSREIYLSRHENSRSWVDFKDFGFYRLETVDIYYVGGFGVMGWVAAEDYHCAQVDPLVGDASRILDHMNRDHLSALILLARVHAGLEATDAAMTAVDRLGFQLRLKTLEGMKGTRINFSREVRNADDTRKVLVEMVRAAEIKS